MDEETFASEIICLVPWPTVSCFFQEDLRGEMAQLDRNTNRGLRYALQRVHTPSISYVQRGILRYRQIMCKIAVEALSKVPSGTKPEVIEMVKKIRKELRDNIVASLSKDTEKIDTYINYTANLVDCELERTYGRIHSTVHRDLLTCFDKLIRQEPVRTCVMFRESIHEYTKKSKEFMSENLPSIQGSVSHYYANGICRVLAFDVENIIREIRKLLNAAKKERELLKESYDEEKKIYIEEKIKQYMICPEILAAALAASAEKTIIFVMKPFKKLHDQLQNTLNSVMKKFRQSAFNTVKRNHITCAENFVSASGKMPIH